MILYTFLGLFLGIIKASLGIYLVYYLVSQTAHLGQRGYTEQNKNSAVLLFGFGSSPILLKIGSFGIYLFEDSIRPSRTRLLRRGNPPHSTEPWVVYRSIGHVLMQLELYNMPWVQGNIQTMSIQSGKIGMSGQLAHALV